MMAYEAQKTLRRNSRVLASSKSRMIATATPRMASAV